MFSAAVGVVGIFALRHDGPPPTKSDVMRFDYLGTILLALALGLFNFTWNQAALAGWSTPYEWALLIASVATFVAFYLWERHLGSRALVPTAVLQRTSLLVYLSLWMGWMSFGIFLFYTALL